MTSEVILALLVLAWCAVFYLFWRAIAWAKQRKTGAYVFGALVQMLLPDPNVAKTIAIVEQQKKKTVKQQQQESGEDKPE
jgi:hypothetical protein